MKQRIQPYYWLIILAGLFLAAGLVLFSFRMFNFNLKSGVPVEPLVHSGENGLFDFWFGGADFLDLSADRNMTGILFSSSNNKVNLLDRGKRLRWEKTFPSEPLQAKLSSCGNYLAVGTAGGKLFYMSTNQQFWWETDGDTPVNRIAISTNGKWVVVSRGEADQEEQTLELYNQEGNLQWSAATGELLKLFLSGEHIEQGRMFFSQVQDDTVTTTALTLEGVPVWSHEGENLAALSRSGNRLAVIQEENLLIYNYLGQKLWEKKFSFPLETVTFNPQNHSVLLYGKREGSEANLYYFSAEGKQLWGKRIADGSLFAFTADGRYLVTSSWRHYKDDYSQMVLFGEDGVEVERWDVAMRVEYLVVTGNRRFIVLGGEDGYIEVIDLEEQLSQDENRDTSSGPIYSTYSTGANLVTLYFSDGEHLIPVARPFGQTENRIRAAIEELIRGPARDSFLYRIFLKDDRIELRFQEETGRLYLDMSPELATMGGSSQSIAALDSLRLTLSGFPEVREIYFTVNGELVDYFGDGLFLEQPLLQYRWKDPVFVPVRSGERYYLVPLEARDLEIEQRDLTGLLQAVLRTSRAFYFVPSDLQLLGIHEEAGVVTMNLNDALLMLFPEGGGEEEHLHAALLLDALFLTALENSSARKIDILVEGENLTPPEGYPESSRTFTGPYFLNPE